MPVLNEYQGHANFGHRMRSSDAGSGGVQTRISATCFGDDAVNCGLGSGVGREIGLLRAVLRAWS
jgi:hypothetical protein